MNHSIHQLDLSWLLAYRSDTPHFGLDRMKALLALRDNPHLKSRVIHIAGTNGKGSTIAILSQLLQTAGYRVGAFTSPYLTSYNEQIRINDQAISDASLQAYLDRYQTLLKEAENDPIFQGLTEFEVITALAYDYFSDQAVDYVIMEVGMGGRLDSTNVCQPVLTAITSIGLDHVALLGPDLASIAREKAGIIKEGIPVFLGQMEPEAREVIAGIASEKEAPLLEWGRDFASQVGEMSLSGQVFSYHSATREEARYQLSLLGQHQVINAGLALALCDQLLSLPLTKEQVDQALCSVRWPGRLELVHQDPCIVLDGAHNPHALKPLLASLDQLFPGRNKKILFTCIRTKALDEMVEAWQQLENSQLVLTSFEDPRAYSKEELEAVALERGLDLVDWRTYIEEACNHFAKDDILIVTGSLYFLAQARPYLLKLLKKSDSL